MATENLLPGKWPGPPSPPEVPNTSGGGGGGYDAGVSERIAKLEAILPSLATKADIEAVRVDFERGQKENRAWMLGTVLALFVGILGLGNFLASGLRESMRPQTPQPSQAPIILQIPVQTAPQPAAAKP